MSETIISGLTFVHKTAIDDFFNALGLGEPEYVCCPTGNIVIFHVDKEMEEKMDALIEQQTEEGFKYSIYEMHFDKLDERTKFRNQKVAEGQVIHTEYSCTFLMTNRKVGYGNERKKAKREKRKENS